MTPGRRPDIALKKCISRALEPKGTPFTVSDITKRKGGVCHATVVVKGGGYDPRVFAQRLWFARVYTSSDSNTLNVYFRAPPSALSLLADALIVVGMVIFLKSA